MLILHFKRRDLFHDSFCQQGALPPLILLLGLPLILLLCKWLIYETPIAADIAKCILQNLTGWCTVNLLFF